MLKYVDIPGH